MTTGADQRRLSSCPHRGPRGPHPRERNHVRRFLIPLTAAVLLLTPVVTASQAGSIAEAASCTPGYSPCISNKASDVDCYGGGGNGPRYTRRGVVYKVRRGYDRYRLDADHDGKGCER